MAWVPAASRCMDSSGADDASQLSVSEGMPSGQCQRGLGRHKGSSPGNAGADELTRAPIKLRLLRRARHALRGVTSLMGGQPKAGLLRVIRQVATTFPARVNSTFIPVYFLV